MCAGTYFIAIYCGYSLDFIIGYFKAFSNAIFNFDSYGVSIGFSDDNSKTSVSSIVWLYSHDSFIANSKTFSIVITIINSKTFSNSVYSLNSYSVSVGFGFDNSKAFDDGCFNSFEDGVAEL